MLEHFEDAELGGFFFTSDDHEALIHRSKSFSDDAIPAGNGIAARVLIRAGYLLGETRWLEAAERTLRAAWLAINRFPHGHMSLLEALAEYLAPPEIVIIREAADAGRWQRELGKLYAPHRMVFSIPAESRWARRGHRRQESRRASTRAYVCRGSTCSAPVESLADLMRTAQARLATPSASSRGASRARFAFFFAPSSFGGGRCAPALDFRRLRAQRHGHGFARPGDQRLRILDDVRRHLVVGHAPLRADPGTA